MPPKNANGAGGAGAADAGGGLTSTLKFSSFKFHYMFMDQWFETMVYINDESDRMKTGGKDVPIKLTLMMLNSDHKQVTGGDVLVEADQKLLEVDPTTPLVIKSGRATFGCKILNTSMNSNNCMFCLKAEVADGSIPPAFSTSITVIKYQLCLDPSTHTTWENEWYKDEGGRDKCITVKVQLKDKDGRLVRNRRVPLTITLQYDSGAQVLQQEILKISPDSSMSVESGTATIRARIEQVSRSHQGQGFKIFVGPDVDKDPLISDISPVVSMAVTVRSKINKKRKQAAMSQGTGKSVMAAGADMSHHHHPAKVRATDPTLAYVDDPRFSAQPRTMMGTATAAFVASPPSTGADAGSPMEASLTTVLKWISNVLEVLQRVKWKQLGYEPREGLPADQGTPLYEIHNPNEMVEKVLTEYRGAVMSHLDLILKQLEPIIANETEEAKPQAQSSSVGGGGGGGRSSGRRGKASESTSGATATPQDNIDMPAFGRQTSAQYIPTDGDYPSEDTSELPYLVEPFPNDASDVENYVEFIVAKVLIVKGFKVGFPAFDRNRTLIGFYREISLPADAERGPNALPFIMGFMPLDHVRRSASLSQQNINTGSQSLQKQIQQVGCEHALVVASMVSLGVCRE